MSQDYLTKKRERQNKSNSLNSNITEEIKEKYYSLFISLNCGYCYKKILKEDKVECKRCFRSFHKNCVLEMTYNETKIIKDICTFCIHEIKNSCCKCGKFLNKKQDIIIQCELCGNQYHFHCFLFPLYYIYRKYCYYEFVTKNNDTEEKYDKFLEEISNLEKNKGRNINYNDIKNIIKKCKFNNKVSDILSNNIFFVCIMCQLKKYYKFNHEIIMYNSTVLQKITFSKKIGKIHELVAPINSIGDKIEYINYENSPLMKKIIDEFTYKTYKKENKLLKKKYYLVLWDNYEYTIELENFITCFNEFDNCFNQYKKYKEIVNSDKNYFQNQNEFKEKVKEFKLNKKNNDLSILFDENQFIYSDSEFLEKFRNEQIIYLFNYLFKSKKNAKILIFTDNNEIKDFYINYFNKKQIYISIENNPIDQIFYECLKLNSKNKLHYSIEEIYNSIKEKSHNLKNDLLDFFEKMEFDKINDLIPDLIFISPKILEDNNFLTLSLLLYFKFDLFIFDIINNIEIAKYFKIISKLINEKNINENSLIYLFITGNSINNEIIQNHCLEFFSLFFDKNDSLLTDTDQIFGLSKINILNSKLKKISGYELNRIILNNKKWNFTFGKNGPKFLNILSNLWSSHITIKYSNHENNFSKIIINLIPINIDIEAFQQYLTILKEKKLIVYRTTENKKDLLKALLMLCSFPNAMPKFYITHLESSLPIKENINPSKAESLYQLKKILENDNEENSQIIIIYSIDDKTYIEISDIIKRDLKRIIYSNTKNLKKDVFIYCIEESDLFEQIDLIQNKTYIIFFNVFLNDKNFFILYDKLIKKNKEVKDKIIIFQLYINDLLEDNLLQIMYSRFEEMFQVLYQNNNLQQKKTTLYSQMTNEERECIIVRNLKECLNNYIDNPTQLNINNFIINYSDDIEKNCDGLICLKENYFILCKNSNNIASKIKIKTDRKILNDLKFLDNFENKFKELESIDKNNISNSEEIEFIEEIQVDRNENEQENNLNDNNINEINIINDNNNNNDNNENNIQNEIENSINNLIDIENEDNENNENNLIEKINKNNSSESDEDDEKKKDTKLYNFMRTLLSKNQNNESEEEENENEDENNDDEYEENENEENIEIDNDIIRQEYSDELFVKLKNNINYDIIYNNQEKNSKSTKNESQLDEIGLNIQNIQSTAYILKDITKSNGY